MGSTRYPASELHLVQATPAENDAQTRTNSSEWRGILNLDQYLRREAHLSTQDLTANGGLTAWMLVHQPSHPNGERQVLCGCETIKKRALVSRNGKVEDVISHGVCSVFCAPENRGKGYARIMMLKLGEVLKEWQVKEDGRQALFSVLYSDIGKEFYAKAGWKVFPSAEVNLPAKSSAPVAGVRLLKAEELEELCVLDEQALRTRLEGEKEGVTVALVPDVRTMRWHHAREEFVAQEVFGKIPEVKGAVVGSPGYRIWVIWTRVWTREDEGTPNTLHILRLGFEAPELNEYVGTSALNEVRRDVAGLFAAAQNEASEWGMEEVLLWNPGSIALAAARSLHAGASVVERQDESIASLRWYGMEEEGEALRWEANEKYGWC